jgi:hypothetical protein
MITPYLKRQYGVRPHIGKGKMGWDPILEKEIWGKTPYWKRQYGVRPYIGKGNMG